MADWPVAFPRLEGAWTTRSASGWGVLDPEEERVEEVEPAADGKLPGLGLAAPSGHLVGYRFGRRAIVATPTSFVKVVRPRRVADLVARHRLVSDATATPVGPRVFGAADDGRVELSIVDGQSVHDVLRLGVEPDAERLSAVVAALHDIDVPEWLPVRALDDPGRWVDTSRRAPTEHLGSIEAVAGVLPIISPLGEVVVHGDLHDKNVFLADSGDSLIDLDGLALGAREDDLANLAVHLELRSLQAGQVSSPGERADALYRAHHRRADLDAERLLAVERHTWFRLACLYQYRVRSRDLVPEMLRRATVDAGQQHRHLATAE